MTVAGGLSEAEITVRDEALWHQMRAHRRIWRAGYAEGRRAGAAWAFVAFLILAGFAEWWR